MVKKLFGVAVFALILAAFVGAAPAAAAELPGTPATPAVAAIAPAAPAGCGQTLSLPTKGESCSAAKPESVLPGVVEPSDRLGYCHCGCTTARCHTSADCGGASCDQFISCC